MTKWERVCQNLGLDPVNAVPKDLKILGKRGYTGLVETTCHKCGLEMEGQFRRCIRCGGDWEVAALPEPEVK